MPELRQSFRRGWWVLALAAAWPLQVSAENSADKPLEGKIIVVDPGHATLDESGRMLNPGARARHGVWERDVALSVSAKLVPLLEGLGAKVYLTRTLDNPWRFARRKSADNRARAIFANVMKANAYVRIHCDWNRDRHFKGFTTFYYRWGSRDLARDLHDAFVKALPGHHDNGIHRRSFVSVTAKMPAVLLELGVLSYKPEGKDLANDAYQNTLAMAITDGIRDYFEKK